MGFLGVENKNGNFGVFVIYKNYIIYTYSQKPLKRSG